MEGCGNRKCVRSRERERERVCVCVQERERERERERSVNRVVDINKITKFVEH